MRSEQRLQQVLTIAGGFLMPLGLAVSASAGTPATCSSRSRTWSPEGLFGLGLTISGALISFSSWLARLIQLQREQAELTRRLLDRTSAPDPSSTQLISVAD
jgi:uncharacterized integral membrane protein